MCACINWFIDIQPNISYTFTYILQKSPSDITVYFSVMMPGGKYLFNFYIEYIQNIIWLVVSTPLKNMSSSVGMIIPNPIFLGKYRIHGSTIHHQTWWSMSLVKGHQFLERNLWSWRLPDFSSGNWTMSVRPDVRPTELLRWKANMFLGHHKVMRSIPWMDTWMGISLKYPSGFS